MYTLPRQAQSTEAQRCKPQLSQSAISEPKYEDVQSIAESTADAYSAATDKVASTSSDLLQELEALDSRGWSFFSFGAAKVAFIANTAIDTVEMAVAILLKGFSDWGADCEISGPSIRDYIEECEITGSREQRMGWWGTIRVPIIECRQRSVLMALDWGRQKCKISLMGQERAQTERDLHGVAPGQRLAPNSRQTSSNTRHGTVFGRPSLRLFGTISTTDAPDGASTSRWSFFFGEKRAVLSLTGWSG